MVSGFDIIKEAVFTERSTKLAENTGIYTFRVNPNANKLQIKAAIELAYQVKVVDVRTITVRPKGRMDRYRGIVGKTRKTKKAMVKLAAGQKIEFA